MEYIEGESLGEYIVRQPDNFVKFDTTMQMMSPILDALEYMHTKTPPIIHRDIKPANIRLTPFGKVYLVDFGIAKAYNPDQPTTTAAQATSTGYSPPEQYYSADQQPQTDVRSDLYSLGATFYYMLSGVVPPDARQREYIDALVSLCGMNPSVAPHIDNIIAKLLALQPDERFTDIASLRQALIPSFSDSNYLHKFDDNQKTADETYDTDADNEQLLVEKLRLNFGKLSTDWIGLHGTGETPLRHLHTELLEEYVSLPDDLDSIRETERKELEQKAQEGRANVWNGERFALTDFYPTRYGRNEEIGITCEFKLTDYAAFRSITHRADQTGLVRDSDGNFTTIRQKYFPVFDIERPNPWLTHSFGINLAVITRDRKLVLTQRNAFVATGKKLFNIPANEGMQYPQDMDEYGKPSFVKAAVRALWEELGVNIKTLGEHRVNIEFLNFGALVQENQYALLGRAKLPLSFQELEEVYFLRAKDRNLETRNQLYAINYLPESIMNFVNSHYPWAHNGLATLYYMMVREWGYEETKRVFNQYPLNDL
jgi:serine/threonine protein kinase